jgi:NADH:ubiquinone oxidoreductase subunit 4 (subunit M)
MSVSFTSHLDARDASQRRDLSRRIANVRAGLALVWAAAVIIAVGSNEPATPADVPAGVALLIASYPLIDVFASLASATFDRASRTVLRVNAAISAAAVVAIATTGFGSDAGTAMKSFGAWAAVSGVILLGMAIRNRRAAGGQLPLIVSGGLSTIAGISFIAQSGGHAAHLTNIGGYMALGALFYLLWAFLGRRHSPSAQ